jgi:hypothetical protein
VNEKKRISTTRKEKNSIESGEAKKGSGFDAFWF